MTRLACTVTTCASYKDNGCCREDIKVKGGAACKCSETRCGSFYEQDGFASSIVPHESAEPETKVLCDVHSCFFHENGLCSAERITVEGDGAKNTKDTMCASFRMK